MDPSGAVYIINNDPNQMFYYAGQGSPFEKNQGVKRESMNGHRRGLTTLNAQFGGGISYIKQLSNNKILGSVGKLKKKPIIIEQSVLQQK